MNNRRDAVPLCRTAVRQLINRFNWQLLSEEEFVARAAETLTENPMMTPMRACLNVYSRESHNACQDACRQEQAYMELHDYLYRKACCRWLELAGDATQEALRLIFEQIDTCRNPGTFLRFAELKLLHAFQIVRGNLVKPPPPSLPPPPSPPRPEEQMTSREEVEKLLKCIRRVWETRPRARDQLRAVLWKYFDVLSDKEIAEQFNKTPAQVHVLRSRGMKKLRQCMAERRYAVDQGAPGS